MGALSDAERLDWLRLARADGVGPITFAKLVARFGTAGDALTALPDLAARAGRRKPLRAPSRAAAQREIEAAAAVGARVLARCEPDYPKALAAIPDPPPILFVCGHVSLFDRPAVAIVGARNASAVGRKLARDLAVGLGAAEIVVTSGLARGVDGAAHEAALATGTIAVVAGGVDVIYPPEHEALTKEIAARGALVSEMPPGRRPTGRDFPRRNRLISGLSRGVVVVEAAAKSGTLITARFAGEQGREVFAVPGSPLDPRCAGANRLLRDGASFVERVDDILDVLAAQESRGLSASADDLFTWAAQERSTPDASDARATTGAVREALSFSPAHRDEILRAVDAPPGLVADALLTLVLAGEADEHPGGYFSRSADGA